VQDILTAKKTEVATLVQCMLRSISTVTTMPWYFCQNGIYTGTNTEKNIRSTCRRIWDLG
jgi:hypothetical protein